MVKSGVGFQVVLGIRARYGMFGQGIAVRYCMVG